MVCVLLATALAQKTVDPVLLALTPAIDARLDPEEWLPFVSEGGFDGFLQWEPGALHFAASVPAGQDVVLYLDQSADGWLVGADNREVRIRNENGVAVATTRVLDATLRGGPEWKSAETKSLRLAGASRNGGWSLEGTLSVGGSFKAGKTIGARLSSVAISADGGAAHLPRALSYVRLGFDAAVGLPSSVTWGSDTRLREVAREDGVEMEFTIKGTDQYSTALVRGEGFARNDLAVSSRPVDKSGFDYKSAIAPNAKPGWRIIQASVGGAVLRTSIKISELVEIEVDLPDEVPYSSVDRSVRGRVDVRSTGVGRIEGQYDVVADPAWTVKKGGEQRVLIYNPRGRERISLDFLVPGGSQGEFSIVFTVTVGSQTFTKTAIVKVLPPGS
jgi:hypothetical protein